MNYDRVMDLACELIKRFEGYSETSYRCPAGRWTVGYGCTGKDRFGDTIDGYTRWDRQFAEDELFLRVDAVVVNLNHAAIVTLTDFQLAALASLAFNVGLAAVKRSRLWGKLNAGDPVGASDEFLDWNMAGGRVLPGLTRRRHAERELFLRSE